MKNRRGCLGVSIMALAVVAVGLVWWNQRDSMGSDAEFEKLVAPLRPKPVAKVPDAQNWYPLLANSDLKIPNPFPANVGAGVDKVALYSPEAKQAFALVDQIVKRPYYQQANPNDVIADFPISSKTRALAKLLAARTQDRLDSGDSQGALRDLKAIEHIGRTCRQDGVLISWLVGRAILSIGNAVLIKGLGQGQFDRAAAMEILTRKEPDPAPEFLDCVLRDLNQYTLPFLKRGQISDSPGFGSENDEEPPNFFDLSHASDIDPLLFGRYQRIETTKILVELVTELEKEARAPIRPKVSRLKQILADIEKSVPTAPTLPSGTDPLMEKYQNLLYRLRIKSTPNGRGLSVLEMLSYFESDMLRHQTVEDIVIRTAAACAVFRHDHKRLPIELDDLVNAKLLPSVPLDPYDGLPLRYDANQGLIWSIGSDGVDSGGIRPGDLSYQLKARPVSQPPKNAAGSPAGGFAGAPVIPGGPSGPR